MSSRPRPTAPASRATESRQAGASGRSRPDAQRLPGRCRRADRRRAASCAQVSSSERSACVPGWAPPGSTHQRGGQPGTRRASSSAAAPAAPGRPARSPATPPRTRARRRSRSHPAAAARTPRARRRRRRPRPSSSAGQAAETAANRAPWLCVVPPRPRRCPPAPRPALGCIHSDGAQRPRGAVTAPPGPRPPPAPMAETSVAVGRDRRREPSSGASAAATASPAPVASLGDGHASSSAAMRSSGMPTLRSRMARSVG